MTTVTASVTVGDTGSEESKTSEIFDRTGDNNNEYNKANAEPTNVTTTKKIKDSDIGCAFEKTDRGERTVSFESARICMTSIVISLFTLEETTSFTTGFLIDFFFIK
jgi:hypothetical protein